jgi:predicted Zn-dependent protease with MMP-like domain
MKTASNVWADRQAPGLDDFQLLAQRAFASLPESFRALVGEVTFVIAEFPDDEVIEAMEIESPFDILGLFHGVGMAHGPALPSTGAMPNRIWLYRRPILDYWAEHEETLGAIVAHVLVHEIGHHFGLSDDDMDMIEEAAG